MTYPAPQDTDTDSDDGDEDFGFEKAAAARRRPRDSWLRRIKQSISLGSSRSHKHDPLAAAEDIDTISLELSVRVI